MASIINNPNKGLNINTSFIHIFNLSWALLLFGYLFVKSLSSLLNEAQYTLKFFVLLLATIINGSMFRVIIVILLFLTFRSLFAIGKTKPLQVGDQTKNI